MLRIGLTGGIGAGKSTVSRILADLGAVVVDSDLVAREVVEPGTEGLAALVAEFGDSILQPDGRLDRPALAAVAFGDDESRARLNAVVHPLVGRRTTELVESAAADAVVVQDIPLLVEGRMGALFNLVLVVYVDAEERVRRLVELRGMPEHDARARLAAQATDDQRRAAADVWLDNSGPQGGLDAEVKALWEQRLVPFEENLRTGAVVRLRPVLAPADPSWPDQARRLIERLWLACGAGALRIDHVGSTSVPGLEAKDVIDVQITVSSIAAADALAGPLAAAGFPLIESITSDDPKPDYAIGGESDPALWDKRTHGGADPGRPVEISLRVDGWPGQRFALLLRDWLRADAAARAEFLEAKRVAVRWAAADADTGEATATYAAALAPWFDLGYQRACEWAERTGWSPS
ncbi:dephospho-CoA kinase [Rhodococcus maanshanensis]|uniref:Dephospho-CoA kinase n=1 Tax=Rhodococcus maanshanensis TaxID=183556 RepID=A0A1H7U3A3_9NOCA|nr:dephospho-CoA kinase [Rhodococcus maanshanensis]SEL91572.1 dephospho-CoA kinase [Rhodococcus maanshanensis]